MPPWRGLLFLVTIVYMSRESIIRGVILKKQHIGETDELVTVYVENVGKVRLFARGIKKPTSKLQYALQPLTEVTLTASGSSSSTIVGAQVINAYKHIKARDDLVVLFFWIAELILKSTSDEESNDALYGLLVESLGYLNTPEVSPGPAFKVKFILKFLETIGLGVQRPNQLLPAETTIYFSNSAGGFGYSISPDSVVVPRSFLEASELARAGRFEALPIIPCDYEQLFALLSGFLSYQIERNIHSSRFLKT